MNVPSMGTAYALFALLGEHCVDPQFSKNEVSIETCTARSDSIQGEEAARSESCFRP